MEATYKMQMQIEVTRDMLRRGFTLEEIGGVLREPVETMRMYKNIIDEHEQRIRRGEL